jgi:predicted transcriptional regulator
MRIIVLSLAATVFLAAASVQAAPVPNTPHAKSHETPAQNVRKSQQYDYLVSTNPGFRAARMKKECGPIRDPGLRSNFLASFREYEPR